MMPTRITINQLTTFLIEMDVNQANNYVNEQIHKLNTLNPNWLDFCRERSSLAIETLSFILRQRLNLYLQGYPSKKQPYLNLIERQLRELKAVYCAFFRLAPGLIYEIKDQAPDVFVWLMLEPEFGQNSLHLLLAFTQLEKLPPDTAKILLLHSSAPDFDCFLARLIEDFPKWAERSFSLMTLRHSLSISLAKHWLKARKLDAQIVQPVLAMLDIQKARQWLDENAGQEQFLFERLIQHHQHRGSWFRQHLASGAFCVTSKQVQTFSKLLELQEFMHFDPSVENAPIELALCGKMDWVTLAIKQLTTADEKKGPQWLQAFYLIYGEKCPVHPKDLGITIEWCDAIVTLKQWRDNGGHSLTKPARLGDSLSYASTLRALKDPFVCAQFRRWIWYQLCLHARIFVWWDPLMPEIKQREILAKLEAQNLAADRFDLRNSHAIVGD